MTDMPLTHCHTCGRELPWNRIYLGDRAYCGAECLPVKTVDILPDPRIAALEADLAEALDVLSAAIQGAWGTRGVLRCQTETSRLAARILAKHRRFRITRWGDDWTEGEWVE